MPTGTPWQTSRCAPPGLQQDFCGCSFCVAKLAQIVQHLMMYPEGSALCHRRGRSLR